MLNFKTFLLNFEHNLAKLNGRGQNYTRQVLFLRQIMLLKNHLLVQLNQAQAFLNQQSQTFDKGNVGNKNRTKLVMVKQFIQVLKTVVAIADKIFQNTLVQLPNVPADSTPTTGNNRIVFTSLHKQKHSALSHWQIGQKLSWLENHQAVQMSHTRFVTYCNGGAQLLRALINWMLDCHHRNGYAEFVLPYLVKEGTLWSTGQFPKLKDDSFQLQNGLFLIPTSEVTLVNFFAKHLFMVTDLPHKVCSYSPCFRQEAGAAGIKTAGLLRLHQFHKVELVKITDAQNSDAELKKMVIDAKSLLETLNLPYRIVQLAVGDLSTAASKTYDLEVWMPFQQKYVEIASLSNTTDFQSQALQIKYRDAKGNKHLCHTLNGSGLAIDRLIACLLETYYDTSLNVFVCPLPLRKYWAP